MSALRQHERCYAHLDASRSPVALSRRKARARELGKYGFPPRLFSLYFDQGHTAR